MQRFATLLFLSAMLALPLLLATTLPGWGTSAWAADDRGTVETARDALTAARCDLCHDASALGVAAREPAEALAAPDLSRLGGERDAASIAAYLRGEDPAAGGHVHWQGTPEELEELADALARPR
jgi:hypothetical protein